MMRVLRVSVAVAGAAVLFLGLGAGSVQAERPERVTVCHNGDDGIQAIRVAQRAVPALLKNGGVLPGASAGTNAVYGDDCSIVVISLSEWCAREGGSFASGPSGPDFFRASCAGVRATQQERLDLRPSWAQVCRAAAREDLFSIGDQWSFGDVASFDCLARRPLT
jgi:hypothetical protein